MPSIFRQQGMIFFFLLCILSSLSTTIGIPLLGGRFETTTDVQEYLNLALDAADMKETDDVDMKKSIYKNGVSRSNEKNADISLASLSLRAATDMLENPLFHIYRHAFLVLGNAEEGETEGRFDGSAIEQYGDTLVMDLFDLDVEGIETEAAVVMNVWMAVINELFQVHIQCKAKNMKDGLSALDKAAAMWIGAEQEEDVNDSGHLLYHLTENAGERFGQDGGESLANTEIIDQFNEIQTDLKGDKCKTLPGYLNMRGKIKRMISLMTIPLLQNLIHHSMNVGFESGSDFVELYALATIPRVAACNPAAYDDELHLDVLREMTPDFSESAIASIERAYHCFGLSCEDIGTYRGGERAQCEDPVGLTVAGYSSDRVDVKQKSYLDRDIKEIDILMKFKAYSLATDWYEYGWNSVYNLQGLANNQVIPKTTDPNMYDLFSTYYQQPNFADDFINKVMQQKAPYDKASAEQIRHLVTDYLKYVVIFCSSSSAFQYAAQQCSNNDKEAALDYWDSGAMFFLGSMEGELPNGSDPGGLFLFSTAKNLCEEFNTCVTSNEGDGDIPTAAANVVIVSALNQGRASIGSGKCGKVKKVLDTILSAMAIPLIQGTIKYASYIAELDAESEDGSLAIADAFARGILPLVDEASSDDALTIKNAMEFDLTSENENFLVVADALRSAIPSMATECQKIGEFIDEEDDANLCGDDIWLNPDTPVSQPTPPSHSGFSQIAWGRYVFANLDVVDADANFALDVRDIYQASSLEEAKNIYTQGKNALTSGLDGEQGLISLQSLSTDATDYMDDEPMFNIFKYGIYDDDDLDEDSDTNFKYADDVIQEALTVGQDQKLAAEGAVIFNVWMLMVHRLYESVDACREKDAPLELLDSIVALWIGQDQKQGLYKNGWMLYSVAQSSAKYFGYPENQEAAINTQLMTMFTHAQALATECHQYDDAHVALRVQVLNIIQRLTVPLATSLLFHMVENSKNMVELYSLSVIPQVYACDQSAAEKLEALLYKGYSYDAVDDEVLSDFATFFRCARISCQDLRVTDNVESNELKGLVDSLCEKLDYWKEQDMENPIAGYQPNKDVSEFARLDLDLLEIEMLTEIGAFDAAMDVYQYGHNSFIKTGETLMTLQSLALYELKESPKFQLFSDYYQTDKYADDLIVDALQQKNDFLNATWEQCSEVASRALQSMVTYMAVQSRMQEAIDYCNDGKMGLAELRWNEAAALFIGSAEGLVAATKLESGRFMYSLSNEVCGEWGTCEDSGEAEANQNLLTSFASGRDSLDNGQCSHIERVMNKQIIPRMAIPLIQGLLSYANEDANAPDDKTTLYSLATVHVFAKALIPLVKEANVQSAVTLEDEFGEFDIIESGTAADDIFDAIANALRSMDIDCNEVGYLEGYEDWSQCGGEGGGIDVDGDGDVGGDGEKDGDSAPLPDTPTNLGNDLYVTTTFVKDKANIGLDVRDMTKALNDGNIELARVVYKNGENSEIFDADGKYVSLRSLAEFSTASSKDMVTEPVFSFFVYALADSDGKFMLKDVKEYANTYVEYAFGIKDNSHKALAAEAAVALNLWMETVHRLYEAVSLCERKELRDEDGIQSMDVAVAYWIGDGQSANDGDRGHVMYGLAEEMGQRFDIIKGGQSRTNRNVFRLFNEAKNELSLPNACSESPTTHVKLRRTAQKIVRLMTVPLLQGLIHNLRVGDIERAKLYGHAIVPLVAGCNPTAYSYLRDKLLNGNFNAIETEKIIDHIRSLYSCLGLKCDDIGVHESERNDEAPKCQDADPLQSLAGYRPANNVQELARIDLDLREIDILMKMNAYQAAMDIYTYGKNVEGAAGESLSLSAIASTSERAIVPQYDAFLRFYDGDTFVDKMIRAALRGDGPWDEDQRQVLVLKGCQAIVMFFGALQATYEAVSDCNSVGSKSDAWDRAAAMMIGSLEGTELFHGGEAGYLFYGLAQEHCKDFGTCPNITSEANKELNSLLYSGRGAVLGNSCDTLRKVANELSALLLIPTIQGALITSIKMSQFNGLKNPVYRAEGYIYSRALLPMVDDIDRDAASTIDKNLGDLAPVSAKNVASDVFSAFSKVYPDMGVDCEMIGVTDDFDPCNGVVYGSSLGLSDWVIALVVFAVIGVACGFTYMFLQKRRKRGLPENNPQFVVSDGELNNHSMNLLEKAFANIHSPFPSSNNSNSNNNNNVEETHSFTQDFGLDEKKVDDNADDDFDEAAALTSKSSSPDII